MDNNLDCDSYSLKHYAEPVPAPSQDATWYWYVVTRKDNGYPVLIYTDYEQAKFIAQCNRENLVRVKRV